MQLNTVIFDMDGLLIDSEPLWHEAANLVFEEYGIHLSESQYSATTGLRTKEFVHYWWTHFNRPAELEPVLSDNIVKNVVELVQLKGKAMPGVNYILDFFSARGFGIGLATSSGPELIEVVVNKLGISHYLQAISSADTLNYGKPHPQVYLDCAAQLQASPPQCLCFEDSFNGMIAAKAAGMKCVIVPAHKETSAPKWYASDLKIGSLLNFNALLLDSL